MEMPDITRFTLAPGPAVKDDSVLLSDLPCTSSLFGDPTWENGVAKGERMLIVIWKKPGTVCLVGKVANPPLKLVVEGHGYDEAMAALEASLMTALVPWQVDDKPIGRPMTKRK